MRSPEAILWPAAVQLALIFALYAWLTVERRLAVARGEAKLDDFRSYEREPLRARLIANSLANQFQLPMLFFVLAAMLLASPAIPSVQIFLAWIFVAARIIHALVHVLNPDVALRGNVFAVNFLALFLMWALFLWERLAAPFLG